VERLITSGLAFKFGMALYHKLYRSLREEFTQLPFYIWTQESLLPGFCWLERFYLPELQAAPLFLHIPMRCSHLHIVDKDISIPEPFFGIDKACLLKVKMTRRESDLLDCNG